MCRGSGVRETRGITEPNKKVMFFIGFLRAAASDFRGARRKYKEGPSP